MSQAQVKAWTFTTGGYPSSLRLSSITPPSKNEVKPNHVLLRIQAAALNPVDIQIMNLPFWSIPISMLHAEKTICSDFSGTVIQGGEGSGLSEGDEVFGVHMKPFNPCAGTLSEIAHMDLSLTCLTKKKPEWRHEQAAGLGCVFLTARTSIDRVAPWVDKSTTKRLVVLAGSSACGIYTIQIAKKRGWKVLTTCSGRNTDFVKSLGADEVVDYTKQNVREAVKEFKPDAVIDNVGGTDCIGLSKRYVTIVGDKTNRVSMGGPLTYYLTFAPMQWIRWAIGKAGLGEVYDVISLDLNKAWLDESKDLADDKIIIDSEFNFEDVKQAYERLNTARARGKVIVKVAQ